MSICYLKHRRHFFIINIQGIFVSTCKSITFRRIYQSRRHAGDSIDSAMGSMNENIDIDKEGKDILIGFNPRFLIDALKVIDDETISIYLVNPKAPCFIRDDEENYTYLILPVNINQNQVR